MGTGGTRKEGEQVRFVFSYREHEPDPPALAALQDDAYMRERVRQLGEWEWEQQGPAEDDLSRFCDREIRSIPDLIERAQDFIVDGGGYPEDLVRIPFEKLAALMAQGGWSFMGGGFMEFEGNHNDTEVTVVLERKSAES